MTFAGKRVLVTGGTGSLGQWVVRRLLSGEQGLPARIVVLSRDEAKQHDMRLRMLGPAVATDEIIFAQRRAVLAFRIGDVRDDATMVEAVREADIIIHAAALKQVPTCEYFPREALLTNAISADVLVRAVQTAGPHVEAVVAISTDKACKPVNVMGMTKALMERVFIAANLAQTRTRFVCVRYGNVIASRGSILPLFLEQIAQGGPVTVTSEAMTRFLLTLDGATEVIFEALKDALPGEIWVPRAPAARVIDIARAVIGDRPTPIRIIGIRPGEKIHEIMVSEEEIGRSHLRGNCYAIAPMLPELQEASLGAPALTREYSSADITLDVEGVRLLLASAVGKVD